MSANPGRVPILDASNPNSANAASVGANTVSSLFITTSKRSVSTRAATSVLKVAFLLLKSPLFKLLSHET